ncbi:MAG: ABC transporter ATP-binding protein [Candidatus Limnocylindrales bacterium]
MTLNLIGVTVKFDSTVAVDRVDLEVRDGERLSVLGPSGSGKSTLLRAICGLEPLASGRIEWDGRDLAAVPVHHRGFGLMFQDYALFPHLNVEQNVRFGLENRDFPRAEALDRVDEVLDKVGLHGYEKRLPAQLSGGEQQRVALARAMAPRPRLLMLDEPLGALDRGLRRSLLEELSETFEGLGLPIIYVTHDHEEALAIGDRVCVVRAGQIETVLPPRDLWRRPPTEFVARFLGLNNIVDAQVDADRVTATLGTFNLPSDLLPIEGSYRLLIRPDAFRLQPDGPITAVVRSATFRGDHTLLRVHVEDRPDLDIALEVQAAWSPAPEAGNRLRLGIDPSGLVLLPLT